MTDLPPRAVLFDMGGVLLAMGNEAGVPQGALDWRGRQALLSRLREAGGRADDEDLEELLFAPWRREYARRYERQREADWAPHLARLIAASGATTTGEELLAAWFRPYGESLLPQPGAAEVPASLAAAGLALAVVSNVALPGRFYREVLARHHLEAPFAAFYFSHDTGSRKPSPAMIVAALARFGVAPGEAVMVGDRQASDVAAGRAAGVRTVWLSYGKAGGPAPDLVIGGLPELPAALGVGGGD